MIIDCHSHINCPTSNVDIAGYLQAFEKIDASIVLTVTGGHSDQANEQVSEYVKQHKKLIGFGVVNPVEDNVTAKAVTASIINMGLEGVVLYCGKDKFHPAHSKAMRFYEAAQQLSIPVFFHNSASDSDAVLDYAQPYLLDEVARSFPELKIVIGGMGLPFVSQTLCMVNKHENVYADLSICPERTWQVYNIVAAAYEAGVMDKLFFGSGYPSAQPDVCIETLLGFNKLLVGSGLPTVPREKIRSVIERDTLTVLGISLP